MAGGASAGGIAGNVSVVLLQPFCSDRTRRALQHATSTLSSQLTRATINTSPTSRTPWISHNGFGAVVSIMPRGSEPRMRRAYWAPIVMSAAPPTTLTPSLDPQDRRLVAPPVWRRPREWISHIMITALTHAHDPHAAYAASITNVSVDMCGASSWSETRTISVCHHLRNTHTTRTRTTFATAAPTTRTTVSHRKVCHPVASAVSE